MGRILTAGGSRRPDRSVQQSSVYRDYMTSPVWQARREYILTRDGHQCQRCGDVATDVHHTTYERLGNEDKEDLISLCRPCHEKADREREHETEARQWNTRLNGWASKVYGDDWDQHGDADLIEQDFEQWLDES